jgi:hypothetical protein
MIFKDVITVYNCYSEGQPPFPPKLKYNRTVIHNVMWKDKTHVTSDNGGKSFIGQTVSVTIPLEAIIEDGKKYVPPRDYTTDDCWTLNADKANPDIIAFGECPEITDSYTVADLRKDYKTANIQAVSDSTNQGILPMWKVGGV